VIDAANARFLREGRRIKLEPKALDLPRLPAWRPGQRVTKDEVLETFRGRRSVSDLVVKPVISDLRAALGDDGRAPRWIETVTRRGDRALAAAGRDAPFERRSDCRLGAGRALACRCSDRGHANLGRPSAHARCNHLIARAVVGRRFVPPPFVARADVSAPSFAP